MEQTFPLDLLLMHHSELSLTGVGFSLELSLTGVGFSLADLICVYY